MAADAVKGRAAAAAVEVLTCRVGQGFGPVILKPLSGAASGALYWTEYCCMPAENPVYDRDGCWQPLSKALVQQQASAEAQEVPSLVALRAQVASWKFCYCLSHRCGPKVLVPGSGILACKMASMAREKGQQALHTCPPTMCVALNCVTKLGLHAEKPVNATDRQRVHASWTADRACDCKLTA